MSKKAKKFRSATAKYNHDHGFDLVRVRAFQTGLKVGRKEGREIVAAQSRARLAVTLALGQLVDLLSTDLPPSLRTRYASTLRDAQEILRRYA